MDLVISTHEKFSLPINQHGFQGISSRFGVFWEYKTLHTIISISSEHLIRCTTGIWVDLPWSKTGKTGQCHACIEEANEDDGSAFWIQPELAIVLVECRPVNDEWKAISRRIVVFELKSYIKLD